MSRDFIAFDLETTGLDPKTDRIIAAGAKTGEETAILTGSTEGEIVGDFFSFLDDREEEVIVGYYSDDFDWKFLRESCKRNDIEFPGYMKEKWCGRLDLEGAPPEAYKRGYAQLEGEKQTVDLYPIVTAIPGGHRWPDRTLGTAAHKLGAKDKEDQLDIPPEKIEEVAKNDPERFERYLRDDLECTYELANILLPQEFELVGHTGEKLQDNVRLGWSSLIERTVEKEYRNRGLELPERETTDKHPKEYMRETGRRGPGVKLKYQGVAENVAKLDVSSMYPSIMLVYDYFPEKDEHGVFKEKLEKLMNRRLELKERAKKSTDPKRKKSLDARQGVLKFLINSFNGHMGYKRARWRDYDAHCNVLEKGRELIEEIIAIIEEEGYDWAEYDTDGAMVIELEDENSGQELARKINEELPEGIEIEFESFWKRGYFHKRKHYATLDSAKNEVEFVGGWFFKKDVPEIVNSTVRDISRAALSGKQPEEIKQIVLDVLSTLKRGKVAKKDLTFRKRLNKALGEYETSPQHVKAAKHAGKVGKSVGPGEKVEYFISKDGPKHISSFEKEEVNFRYYRNRVVSRIKTTLSEIYGVEQGVIFNHFVDGQRMLDEKEIHFTPKKQLVNESKEKRTSGEEGEKESEEKEAREEEEKFAYKEFGWGFKGGSKQRNIFYDVVDHPEKAEKFIEKKNRIDIYTTVYRFPVEDPQLIRRTTPRRGFWHVDFDYDDDPVVNLKKSLEDSRRFFQYLTEEWEIPPEEIRIVYSGSQGVHLEVPQNVFGLPRSCRLPDIYKEITRRIAEKLDLELKKSDSDSGGVDLTIYTNKRLWGITNTVHPETGKYRIPLNPEDLDPAKAEEIFERADEPEGDPVYYHEDDDEVQPLPKAEEKTAEILEDLEIDEPDHGGSLDFKRKPEKTKKFKRHISNILERGKVTELPPCCKRIIELIRKGESIGWHGRWKLARELKKLGKDKEEISDYFTMAPSPDRYKDMVDRLERGGDPEKYEYDCSQALTRLCSPEDCPYIQEERAEMEEKKDPTFEEYQESVGDKFDELVEEAIL